MKSKCDLVKIIEDNGVGQQPVNYWNGMIKKGNSILLIGNRKPALSRDRLGLTREIEVKNWHIPL